VDALLDYLKLSFRLKRGICEVSIGIAEKVVTILRDIVANIKWKEKDGHGIQGKNNKDEDGRNGDEEDDDENSGDSDCESDCASLASDIKFY